jgi:hypothetical protein
MKFDMRMGEAQIEYWISQTRHTVIAWKKENKINCKNNSREYYINPFHRKYETTCTSPSSVTMKALVLSRCDMASTAAWSGSVGRTG